MIPIPVAQVENGGLSVRSADGEPITVKAFQGGGYTVRWESEMLATVKADIRSGCLVRRRQSCGRIGVGDGSSTRRRDRR